MSVGLLANMNVKLYMVVILLFGIAAEISGADVSATSCTSGGNQCDGIANATCDTSGGNCKCNDGYKENKETCQLAVSGKACTDKGIECNSISNAECVTSKCKCKDGYKETANSCTQVYGTTCSDIAPCPDLSHLICNNSKCLCAPSFVAVNNVCVKALTEITCTTGGSECPTNAVCNASKKCECGPDFALQGNQCLHVASKTHLPVSSTVCAAQGNECNSIANAECVTKNCKCKNGFKEDANTCKQVYGTACNSNTTCLDLSNSICTNSKCQCASSYVAVNNVCEKALTEIICTNNGNECPTNAVCSASKKCECGPDFALQGNQCSAKSGATSTKFIVWVAFSSSLMIIVNKLLM